MKTILLLTAHNMDGHPSVCFEEDTPEGLEIMNARYDNELTNSPMQVALLRLKPSEIAYVGAGSTDTGLYYGGESLRQYRE